MKITLDSGRIVDIHVKRKNIKNMILRVYPDGSVGLSIPRAVTQREAAAFADTKRNWLEKHLQRAEEKKPQQQACELRILGRVFGMEVRQGEKNEVRVEKDTIIITAKDPSTHMRVLDKWWRKAAYDCYAAYADGLVKLVGNKKLLPEKISVRKMKSMWGSCSYNKKTIRLNYYLMCAPEECVEYVVLHELAHLIYPNHGGRFKSFLTKYMPDWKARKKQLAMEPLLAGRF
ncbi:MAG: M48 family metallopeptidase [Christensenellaceae bacterium]|jgi:predicted metal-dependent hydrolase